MNTREYFIQRFEAEQPAFINVLRAVPAGQLSYRPHERSASAGNLAWQLADQQRQMSQVVDEGKAVIDPRPAPASIEEIVAAYESATADLRSRLAALDDARWDDKAEFIMGGKTVMTATIGETLWGYLFDGIHHRGQLSAYLRPMGGKVPMIYGPSGDATEG